MNKLRKIKSLKKIMNYLISKKNLIANFIVEIGSYIINY